LLSSRCGETSHRFVPLRVEAGAPPGTSITWGSGPMTSPEGEP
jgi:hypothetical protein